MLFLSSWVNTNVTDTQTKGEEFTGYLKGGLKQKVYKKSMTVTEARNCHY